MKTHELKTWPGPFAAVLDGTKRHEIRKNDRGYQTGDVLHLREWEPSPTNASCVACGEVMQRYEDYPEYQHIGCGGLVESHDERGYTGRDVRVRVTYLSNGGSWGLPRELCVMSITTVEQGGEL